MYEGTTADLKANPDKLHSAYLLRERRDAAELLERTESWWRGWARNCATKGKWREPVVRSLITLKTLTYSPTGGIVAAATTSLPERIGGVRHWD